MRRAGVRLQTSRFMLIHLISCWGICRPFWAIWRIASWRRRMAWLKMTNDARTCYKKSLSKHVPTRARKISFDSVRQTDEALPWKCWSAWEMFGARERLAWNVVFRKIKTIWLLSWQFKDSEDERQVSLLQINSFDKFHSRRRIRKFSSLLEFGQTFLGARLGIDACSRNLTSA